MEDHMRNSPTEIFANPLKTLGEKALEDLQSDPFCPEDISASDHALDIGCQIIRGSTKSSMCRLRSAEDFEQLKETVADLQQHGVGKGKKCAVHITLKTDFRPADGIGGESDSELPNAARTNKGGRNDKGEKKYGNNPTKRMLKDIKKANENNPFKQSVLRNVETL
ncbi:hypothetical protein SAICODRAFT_7843 [Saitoella complicata NRRL Y-17804]|uniref:uncharacterized protein n=1 Tax=Saitoella complicata (strain BCRC 22490 / CBS 7301 / JCM 7358 / NBRC 10748 / NRRL Y-17804) TaxID=698492 RepID=UPI000866BFC9|nr:uncharacterized protein SAICODRAFT_7843 [Saitoella complicata NRRL Y-17804]ODQ52814.1 hypothetical protein SAICODRAFT_7843 [Saitoella complicata NRRL Y-17804]